MTQSLNRTFSTVFPSYHIGAAGECTHFVESMFQWYYNNVSNVLIGRVPELLQVLNLSKFSLQFYQDFADSMYTGPIKHLKGHTIRAGNWFKPGDFIRPCIWTGKPYRSLQMQFLPALVIPKVWKFEIKEHDVFVNGERIPANEIPFIANNDGLTFLDFMHWFKYPNDFDGQIICWDQHINYQDVQHLNFPK